MKTVGDKLEAFAVTGVKPGQPEDAFYTITENSFEGKWKVIVYYPKDFTFVCPTEIVAYDKLASDFADRDAVLLTGAFPPNDSITFFAFSAYFARASWLSIFLYFAIQYAFFIF